MEETFGLSTHQFCQTHLYLGQALVIQNLLSGPGNTVETLVREENGMGFIKPTQNCKNQYSKELFLLQPIV